MKIGFIGLCTMGASLAINLQREGIQIEENGDDVRAVLAADPANKL